MFKGLMQFFAGIVVLILTAIICVAWWGFCFGTVIVGILLLIFVPQLLLFPLAWGGE